MVKKKKKKLIKKIRYTFNFKTKNFKFYSKYFGLLIKRGKKANIENGFFNILRNVKKEKKKFILTRYLTKSINQARPYLTLITKKRGSISYNIPVSVGVKREIFQSIYWIINESCGFKKGNYEMLLVKEFINLSYQIGNAMRAKKNLHKIGEQNRIYIRYLV